MNIIFFLLIFIIFRNQIQIHTKSYNNKENLINTTNNYNNRKLSTNLYIEEFSFIDNENEKVSYIASASNENGEIYIISNSEDSSYSKRFVYLLKPSYNYDSKLILMESSKINEHPLLAIIKISGKEYLTTYSSSDGHFELIDYDKEKIYYSPASTCEVISRSEILKNTFFSLKYKDKFYYVISAFIDKLNSNLIIQKLYFKHKNIEVEPIECSKEKIVLETHKNCPVSCFENGDFIECLYMNLTYLYTVSVFDFSNLEEIYSEIIEEKYVKSDNIYSKCIYIKDNLGAFLYFINYDKYPKLQFISFEVGENEYSLNSFFGVIDLNSQGIFSISPGYIFNAFIYSNENNIYYVNSFPGKTELYIILIKLLNDNKNILINYYEVKIHKTRGMSLKDDLNAFSLNGLLGIGMTINNHLTGSKNAGIFLFCNLTMDEDISIRLEQNNIFNEENTYQIGINKMIEKCYFKNNIFAYEIAGIKIISSLEEENGFYVYSKELENKVTNNQIISTKDSISFKLISEIGIKLGEYSIEYALIIKEPEYKTFISTASLVELFPKNDSNQELYESFYQPDTFLGRTSFINFTIEQCYKSCQTCNSFGDSINHHCINCSINYIYSYWTSNGINCVDNCPENYELSDNNICLNNEEENIKETNKLNEEENIKETNKLNEEENIKETNILYEEENIKETNILYEEENIKEEEQKISNDNKYIEEEIIKEKFFENEEEIDKIGKKHDEPVVNNAQIKCEKYYYIDEYSNVHCINGDKCIDEYPHLDRIIKNLCTNCIYKYKNMCYMECPENTCIKQDINLDTCLDIKVNIKVVNRICFDNFEEIAKNMKNMSENNVIIENIPNLTVYAYDIGKNISYFEEKKLTYIYFKDIHEKIIQEFNLEENVNIYALVVESPSKYSNSTINDYGFVLLLENGTELNLSKLEDNLKVKISIPIINLELANFDYAVSLSEQGYDIYNQSSEFYHDICTPGYLKDEDLAFRDRKNEIYPNNVTLGKTNCEYILVEIVTQRFVYDCSMNSINKNNTNNNMKKNFDIKPKKDNFFNYIIDVVNYKILNCSALFVDLDNFRHNKAVMICTCSIFVSVFLLILFFCCRIPKIRILMYKEIPTSLKIKEILVYMNKRKRNSIISNNNIKQNPNQKKNFSFQFENRTKKSRNSEKIINRNSSDRKCILINADMNIDINDKKNTFIYLKSNNKFNSSIKSLSKIKYEKKKVIKKIREKPNYEYDDLPYETALKMDEPKWYYILKSKIIEKIKIFNICINKRLKEILLSEYFLYLLIDLTTNAILYSDNIVSHKSHNNGRLDSLVVLLLTAFANILASIIGYYLEALIDCEGKIILIKDIMNEKEFLRVFKIIIRELIIRVIIFFVFQIIIIIFCTYYLFIFFTIYHKSQMSLLKNYLISLLENWLINLVIAIFIVVFRKVGIYYKNKYLYNTSKFLDKNF